MDKTIETRRKFLVTSLGIAAASAAPRGLLAAGAGDKFVFDPGKNIIPAPDDPAAVAGVPRGAGAVARGDQGPAEVQRRPLRPPGVRLVGVELLPAAS